MTAEHSPFAIEMPPGWGLFLGLLLVALNGFFVAAEFALVKVRGTQLDTLIADGNRRAQLTRRMTKDLDAYLSATQVGITLASLALGWIGEPAFAHLIRPLVSWIPGMSEAGLHTLALVGAFLTITILHIVVGELAPKSVAIRKPEPVSLWIAYPLWGFYHVIYPAIWLLNHAANFLLRLVGVQPVTEGELAHSEEEVRLLLTSEQATELSDDKREILDNVFELSHRNARQVMVPRADVIYLEVDEPVDEALARARESGHTRFPLCHDGLDTVVGMVHIKDVFRNGAPPHSLVDIQRPMGFVTETLTLDKVLARMRKEKAHMAAVLDEFGGVSGIVTLENVIEELVGPIQDEFDRESPDLVQRADNLWDVAGAMLVEDLEDELDTELDHRDEATIGGVVLSDLGREAKVGDEVMVGPMTVKVVEVDGNRIQTLRLRRSVKTDRREDADGPAADPD